MNPVDDHATDPIPPAPIGEAALSALRSHGEADAGSLLIVTGFQVERALRSNSPKSALDEIVARFRSRGFHSNELYLVLCAIQLALDQDARESDSFTDPLGEYLDALGGWCPSAFQIRF